jgi:hypothetical protein
MKTIIGALLALGFLAGTANAAPVGTQNETVLEYGCGYGYGH